MRRKLALVLGCLAACEFNIDIGSRDAAGPFDAGSEELFCPEPSQLTAFEVRLDAMPLTEPSCWRDGVVPARHTLPEETFHVLVAVSATTSLNFGGGRGAGGGTGVTAANIAQQTTLALDGLGPQRLGDAPVIELGAAMDGFAWQRTQRRQPRSSSEELRITSARFEFDRLDLSQTAGQLVLSSSWSCASRGGCELPPDRMSCAVSRPFVARRLAEVPARWLTPSTEAVEGAEPYLVTMDLGALSRGMTCTPQGEVSDSTPNLRALEVWQFAPNVIRVPARSVIFPVAPPLALESDFPRDPASHGAQLRGFDLLIRPGALERRTTTASLLGRRCGAWATGGGVGIDAGPGAGFGVKPAELVLESRYECIGEGCTALQSYDRGTCRVVVPWLPLRLP